MKLDISEYELATKALLGSLEMGLDISDKQAIARIYRTIWAKSREEQKLFDNCLNELLSQQKNVFSEFHQFIETATNNYIPEVTAAEEEIIENSSTSNSEIPPESTFESETFSEVPPQPNFQPESSPQQIPESETFPKNSPQQIPGSETFSEISPQQIPESKTFPEILLPPTFNNPQVATAIPKNPKNGDYFPVSIAQIQRTKRLLFQPQLTDFSSDINVKATVQKIAKQGFFVQPIYQYGRGKPRKIFLLIDQSESMMPFNPFCRQIINSWQEANIYYFDNVPRIRAYTDPDFSEKKSLKTILAGLVKEETLVLILSDGGAARGRFVSERVEKTENFLKFLSRKVERVAWLNPLPRQKWRGTSAEEISAIGDDNFNLKTFGLNYQEFKAMCQWLIYGKLGRNLPVLKTDIEEVEIVNENVDQIAAFTEYFGEPHLIFAQHAAFPLALTPDLLYRLWQRFFARERNFNIPWYAVADILLSSFCHPVDRELYEMDRGIRNHLLQLCTERFGQSRLEELSRFLVSYINSQVKSGESVSSVWQGQRWTALAYTRPELAARQLAESLQEAYGRDDKAELVRLSSLMETLAEPLREYEPLLVILGQGYGGYARGDVAGVENVRRELGRSEVVNSQTQMDIQTKLDSSMQITIKALAEEIVKLANSQRIDYTRLRNLLANKKWKEADEETAKLMFKIADRKTEGWLRIEDIEQFPIADLQTIDQLWVKHSNGRFGFSVQKQIYQNLGGTKEFNQKITAAFWQKVGLVVNNQPYWSQYHNPTFDLSAPIGHLPIGYDLKTPANVFGVVEGLLSHPGLVFQESQPTITIQPKPPLETFSFEVVTVNRRGEEINRVWKEAKFFTEDLGGGVILEMVAIPGGTFIMGSPENEERRFNTESPQHQVTLQPFLMSKYPITQDQYLAIMGENPSHFKGGNRPVERVTWHKAIEFCQQLSQKTGKNYILPSESQWEYACRAGTTTPFYFGDTITTDLVNYNGNHAYASAPKGIFRGGTTDVGSFPPNTFGLYDLHGNVWEWCLDIWHYSYAGAPTDGSAWLDNNEGEKINNENEPYFNSNDEKELYPAILRGGSWFYIPDYCRSAIRFKKAFAHDFRSNDYNYGFRVVCSFDALTNQGESAPNIQPKQQPIILPSSKPEPIITPQPKSPLETFSFEVVTVNNTGEEINRVPKQAEFFTEDLGGGVILEMVSIPGGSFIMGSPENEVRRLDTESPQHKVTLQPFYISKYPITQEQYQAITGKNPSRFRGKNRPVETVKWGEATKFCERLSEKTGKTYRLPSESQWEYACRAGTTTPFYFGETITTDLANYNNHYTYASAPKGIYRQETTDVGSFLPNSFGLYDMHGNVWEWCQDIWHDNYEGAPTDGSAWLDSNDKKELYRLLRGGSWYLYPYYSRSAARNCNDRTGFLNYIIGFRIICSAIPTLTLGDKSASNIQQKQQPIILPSTKPEPIITPQPKLSLKTFSFEVITVNHRGEEINRVPKQAEFFTEDLGGGVILEMVSIPGGSFIMGSPENEPQRLDTESPQHQVTLQPFYMSKYPITQDQYLAIMGKNPSGLKGKNRPVEAVRWHHATDFCQQLSQKKGKIYRLPSESQWEYACRAGTTTPFYFGETITTDLVNYSGNYNYGNAPKGIYRKQTTDVGSFPANAFGLYDMHGNVWEWCQDIWHDNYEDAPNDGSAWETEGDLQIRVLRGGSWNCDPRWCRSADRSYDHYYYYRGFRVVCTSINSTDQSESVPNTQQKEQPIILPSTKPEAIITPQPKLPLKTFSFEVITVNNRGKEINRVPKQAQYFTEDLGKDVILEMVAIPGGKFVMGSPESEERRFSVESPQHQVTLQPFYMSKYPITQKQYLAVMDKNPSHFKGRNRPVETVTWYNATEFCQKLSQKTTKIYQLPSESQWEYACRAGTTTPFYFGETITSELVNYNGHYTYRDAPQGRYREQTTNVGSFPPNAFGLYDLHGNVWEWCQDIWHDNYEDAPTDGSAWEDRDTDSSPLRGGSWYDHPDLCRSAVRVNYFGRVFRYNYFGFRIVCSAIPTLTL
ncbi:MAG: SUMF1/EgtB/PvdO family nonheme iron enzyme [Trichodesmium sp. MO_231.B1]|nr:SUMF1/EgtB/PvdO family nonheme iron enzyme [Trichodesmium sp. MO_231.B1]